MRDTRALATSPEVATHLGISPRTLDQWAWRRTGPKWSKVGRSRRYRWADVEKWVESQATETGGTAA
jgi:predicted DNA-binding transcriptional regulator AlpA